MNPSHTLALSTLVFGLVMGVQTRRPASVLTPEEAAILARMSLVDVLDDNGVTSKTILISGVNLQIVSGDGNFASPLRAGNLIIGYPSNAPSGSHNLLLGEVFTASNSSGCLLAGAQALAMS